MATAAQLLLTSGICETPDIYTGPEIVHLNAAVDPIFASRLEQKRSYVHVDEMLEAGILDVVLSQQMKDVLLSVIPDAVLYHCHMYEIAARSTQSHIFSQRLFGWHRDPDSEYVDGELTHVSIFVYLTNVGEEDGAFEFVPELPPTKWLSKDAPFISVQGPAGFSFAWHRNFYHRAAPNRGPVRRRLLKISIQRNRFLSANLTTSHFKEVISRVAAGDPQMDILLGRYQGKKAPDIRPSKDPIVRSIAANRQLNLPTVDVTKAELIQRARSAQRLFKKQAVAAGSYD